VSKSQYSKGAAKKDKRAGEPYAPTPAPNAPNVSIAPGQSWLASNAYWLVPLLLTAIGGLIFYAYTIGGTIQKIKSDIELLQTNIKAINEDDKIRDTKINGASTDIKVLEERISNQKFLK
jgi:hypothetical protein